VRRRKKLIAAKPVRVEKPVVKSQRAISDQTRYYMEQVIKMRANDVPYSEIAEILGITHEMARRIHDQACKYIPSLRVNEYREKLTEDLDWAKKEIKRIAQTFIPRVTVTGGVVRAPVLDENGNEDEEEKVLRDHDMWLKSLKEFSNIVSQQGKLHGVNLPVSNFNANNNHYDFKKIGTKEEFAEVIAEIALQRDLQGGSVMSAGILQALITFGKIKGFIDANDSEQILAKYIVLPMRDENLDNWKTKEIESPSD